MNLLFEIEKVQKVIDDNKEDKIAKRELENIGFMLSFAAVQKHVEQLKSDLNLKPFKSWTIFCNISLKN